MTFELFMMQTPKIVVLVSGRGSNLQALIDAQTKNQIQSHISLVISNKPNAFALERAQKAGIRTLVITDQNRKTLFKNLLQTLKNENPDWIVLAGFMKILPPEFIQTFPQKIINIHPSLLPDFKGLNAQKQALEAGVSQTGCTVHFVDEGCDTGPIILQKTEAILPNDTVESLSARLLQKEHACLVEALQLLEKKS